MCHTRTTTRTTNNIILTTEQLNANKETAHTAQVINNFPNMVTAGHSPHDAPSIATESDASETGVKSPDVHMKQRRLYIEELGAKTAFDFSPLLPHKATKSVASDSHFKPPTMDASQRRLYIEELGAKTAFDFSPLLLFLKSHARFHPRKNHPQDK